MHLAYRIDGNFEALMSLLSRGKGIARRPGGTNLSGRQDQTVRVRKGQERKTKRSADGRLILSFDTRIIAARYSETRCATLRSKQAQANFLPRGRLERDLDPMRIQ